MNKNAYEQVEMQINLKEVIWDLLEQWKAVLIGSLVMAILVCGLKYAKDMGAYNAGKEQRAADAKNGLTAEQRINELVSSLPKDEQSTVEYLIKQEEWIAHEKEYISKSILMNTNPANQRILTLDYYVAANDNDNSNMASLMAAYDGYAKSKKFVEALGQAIDPDAESRYIAELINADKENGDSGIDEQTQLGADEAAAVVALSIALPEDADAAAVEAAVTNTLKEHSGTLSKRISPHSITIINTAESYRYNAIVVQNRNNLLNSIYYLTNNAKNMQGSLTDEQKSVFENAKAIRKEESELTTGSAADSTQGEKVSKPGFSKKFAVLGFVLGCIAYAFVYLMMIIIKGRVDYASNAEFYTQSRLLGEVYGKSEHRGIRALLHSSIVDKWRYKDKLDADLQQTKIVDVLTAVCKHTDVREATVYGIVGNTGKKLIETLVKKACEHGIKLNLDEVSGDIDEKSLPSVDNALFVISPEAKVADVSNLAELCRSYDISTLGTVFTGDI